MKRRLAKTFLHKANLFSKQAAVQWQIKNKYLCFTVVNTGIVVFGFKYYQAVLPQYNFVF